MTDRPKPDFVLDDEVMQEIPLQFKLAALELAKQFNRVVVDDWHEDGLHVRVYRDKDTVNPTTYNIVRDGGVFYRKETRGQRALWPVYKSDPKPPTVTKAALRRSTVSRLKAARTRELGHEVTERNTHIGVQSLFVERAEIDDDLKQANLDFMNEPNIHNAMTLKALRAKLSEVELKIVALNISVQMQRTLG